MSTDEKVISASLPKHLRVLHIGPLPPPVGGMSTILRELSTALKRHCEIQVFSNAKTTSIDRTLFQAITAQFRLLCLLVRTLWQWQPDIVHIHTCSNFTFWRNGLDLILARCFGCKTILHIHGGRFHLFLGGLGYVYANLARVILRRADRIIVLGHTWLERLAPWCRPGTIEVIPNGIMLPDDALGPNKDNMVAHIVCVANYEPGKGLDKLIRAAANLPADGRAWRITFLGAELNLSYKQSLQQLSRNLGVENRVSLPGPVNASQITDFLRSAYLFCLPSHNEGLPMSMLEAMAHALPIVATKVGAIPEAVKDGVEAFLYQPEEIGALSAALSRLLEEPELALRMGQNARRRLIREYTLTTMCQRVFKLYQQLFVLT